MSALQAHLFQTKQTLLLDRHFAKVNTTNLGKQYREAFTLMLECERAGFSFDKDVLHAMSNGSKDELVDFWGWLKKEQSKVFRGYKPMYPNFPKQVIDASEAELLVNALMHYAGDWFGLRILPQYDKELRQKLKEKTSPMLLRGIVQDDLLEMFRTLVAANTSMSPSSKELMGLLFSELETAQPEALIRLLEAQTIPQKETLAYLGALVLKSKVVDFNETLAQQLKSPTDLLRLSAALNEGDVSLAEDTRIKNMSRPMRRAFVSKLEQLFSTTSDSQQLIENLFTYKEQWTKLAHAMHVGEYQKQCPLAYAALQKVRSNAKGESFLARTEKLTRASKVVEASAELAKRPGVFCRQLNRLLVSAKRSEIQTVLDQFSKAAASVSTPVLLQTHAKFKHDHASQKHIVLPKGGLGRVFVKHHDKNTVSEKTAAAVVKTIEDVLIARFKHGPSLGRVYIQDEMVLQHVPFAQRSASKALKTVAKGSRFVREDDKPTLRFFTWWNESGVDKQGKTINVGRVDIDLSVGIFDASYNLIAQCAYYDLRGAGMAHSGDITSAPHGAAEYIDVNVEQLKKSYQGAAYVGQLISSFTNQPYSDIPECYAGWMEREQPQNGEIFEPSTVKNKVDITSNATQVLTFLYDIERKEYIWADLALPTKGYRPHLASVSKTMAFAIEGLAEMKKPNLHDLFTLHAKARGELVSSKDEADTVFSLDEGVTPYDFERIGAEFMTDSFESAKPGMKLK